MKLVIGGGPAGRIAAMRLAEGGEEVTLVDRGGLGGQCLHYGCMVVCALNDVARHRRQAAILHERGFLDRIPEISFPSLLAEMAGIQDTIHRVIADETKNAGVTVLAGKTAAIDGATVTVGDEPVDHDGLLIATGSRPNVPAIEGITLPGVFSPHSLATMPGIPRRLAIIGGGVMAAEFTHIFGCLGAEVEVICRSGFLPSIDPRLRDQARRDLSFATIREHTLPVRIGGGDRARFMTIRCGEEEGEIDVDAVFVAAGLVPRSEAVSGIAKGPAGEILVDKRMRTNVPGVWAAGDVTGPPFLTPVARKEGQVAADTMLGREARIDHAWIPQSMSLMHDYAFCTGDIPGGRSLSIPAPAGPGNFWSVPDRRTGMAKISFGHEEGRITGMYAAAPGAALFATYLAYLMRRGATIHDFEDLCEVHPSTDGIYWLLQHTAGWLRKNTPKP
ncbi:MAG: NAD(P)/FAD-dependent oxidoreductase [Methanomicrobiales archaeon]|nr:NAD(P)/FAD-dependent oxidoreductase [Methanomicrobiales archaeon]